MKRLAIFLVTMFFLTSLISCTNNAGGASEDVASSSSSIVSSEPETSSIEVAGSSIETIESIEESSSAVETKESTEASTEPTEESTDPTEESSVEPTTESTPEPTVQPTVEPTATPTPKPTEEPTTESTPEPTVQPTVEPTVQPTSTPTPTYSTTIEKYIADGSFTDFIDYGYEMGIYDYHPSRTNINFTFKSGSTYYAVMLGTDIYDDPERPGMTFIATGSYDVNSDVITFLYACDFSKNSGTKLLLLEGDNAYCTSEQAMALERVINYMKSHPDPYTIPSISGMAWEPW